MAFATFADQRDDLLGGKESLTQIAKTDFAMIVDGIVIRNQFPTYRDTHHPFKKHEMFDDCRICIALCGLLCDPSVHIACTYLIQGKRSKKRVQIFEVGIPVMVKGFFVGSDIGKIKFCKISGQ